MNRKDRYWCQKERFIINKKDTEFRRAIPKIFEAGSGCNLTQRYQNTGLFEMIVGVLTTCHTQYTWDRSICIFLFNRTTFKVFVKYLTGALYVHPLGFYKHQYDNRVRSKLFVACQRWWFQWRFWFVPSVPGYLREEEEHKPDSWRNPIERTIYSYLKCIVYDKLLKPRKSFLITLYIKAYGSFSCT